MRLHERLHALQEYLARLPYHTKVLVLWFTVGITGVAVFGIWAFQLQYELSGAHSFGQFLRQADSSELQEARRNIPSLWQGVQHSLSSLLSPLPSTATSSPVTPSPTFRFEDRTRSELPREPFTTPLTLPTQ